MAKKELTVPAELALLRKENQRLRKAQAAGEGALENIQDIIRDIYHNESFAWDIPEPPKAKDHKGDEVVAVAHLTDWQCGKITKTYSSKICRDRMLEYAEKVGRAVHTYNRERNVRELHVYWTGDMVEGELIFPHQAHVIDQAVWEQAVLTVPTIMTEQVLYWLQSFDKIVVKAVHGNHGRPASKHAGSHPKTNWDRVAYHVAKLMIEKAIAESDIDPDRVSVDIADDFYIVDDVLGHKHLLIHGDQGIRGHGGFPWYGVGKKMSGWVDSIEEEWHHLYFGHFHQMVSADINGRRWYCGGTPESDNDWARAELAAAGRPQQRLQLLTREQVICDLPIYLNSGYRPLRARLRGKR